MGVFLVFLYYSLNAYSMARPQYTPEQRNFCVMQYVKNGEGYGVIPKVQTAFGRRFPGVRIPERRSIKDMVDKQNSYYTSHNLNSKASPSPTYSGRPRTGRSARNLARVRLTLNRDKNKNITDPAASPR